MSCCTKIIKAAEVVTECQCDGPGFCSVIGCTLNSHGHRLCKSNPGFLEHWRDNGGAPCVGLGESRPADIVIGLGDAVSWLIRIATLGLLRPCNGCKSRIAWLNSKLTLWRSRR